METAASKRMSGMFELFFQSCWETLFLMGWLKFALATETNDLWSSAQTYPSKVGSLLFSFCLSFCLSADDYGTLAMAEVLLEECLQENIDLLRSSTPLLDKTQSGLCRAKSHLNTILSRGRLTVSPVWVLLGHAVVLASLHLGLFTSFQTNKGKTEAVMEVHLCKSISLNFASAVVEQVICLCHPSPGTWTRPCCWWPKCTMCRAATGMPKECVQGWDWRNWRGMTSRRIISAYSLRLSLLKVLKISEEIISFYFFLPPVLIVFSMKILYTPSPLLQPRKAGRQKSHIFMSSMRL